MTLLLPRGLIAGAALLSSACSVASEPPAETSASALTPHEIASRYLEAPPGIAGRLAMPAAAAAGTKLFDAEPGATHARKIGVTGGRAYWEIETTPGVMGIVSGPSGGGATTMIVAPTTGLALAIDWHVVLQIAGGPVEVVLAGDTARVAMPSSATPCSALASDGASVFCRTSDAIVAWDVGAAPSGPRTVYTDVTPGSLLQVDGDVFYLDIGVPSSATLASLPRPAAAAAPVAAAPSPIETSQSYPASLVVRAGQMTWSTSVPSTHHSLTAPVTGGAPVTMSSGFSWGPALPDGFAPGTTWSSTAVPFTSWISRADPGAPSKNVVTLSSYVGGFALDAAFVYWTDRDAATVWRAPR